MDAWTRGVWFARLAAPRTSTLRRLAVVVSAADAAVIAAAPYLSPRPLDDRELYGTVAVVLAVNALLLVTSRHWPDRVIAALAIGTPNLAVLGLLATTAHAGIVPMLLLWSALASPYFRTRAVAFGNLAVIGLGMLVAVVVSPDPLMSPFTWVVTMLACVACTVTVRLVAEQGDALVLSLSDRARRDPLTGLLNRRAFDERLEHLWEATASGSLAVVVFDLDHFKNVNDTFGHHAGDAVLRAFAGVLRAHVRDGDVVARTGGEEFCVVLPERATEGVLERARAVVDAFGSLPVRVDGEVIRCTTSAGVAVRTPRHESPAGLCREADRALYAAKEAGRNRAVLRGVDALEQSG